MTFNNLCDSCSNYGCEFQSGIVRTKCAFYMPPHLEPDNCGNYMMMQQPLVKGRINEVLDKIRAEIDENLVHDDLDFVKEIYYNSAINDVLQIIDKYIAESEE